MKVEKMEKQNQNIPELRFPEFSEEWKGRKLGDIATFLKGKSISKGDIVESGEVECIRYGELYIHYQEVINTIKSKTNLKSSELVLSEKNDVIIPSSGESRIDIATASCVLKSGVALGGDLNVVRGKNNGVYLSYYLNNKRKRDISNIAQGVSVVHLYSKQISNLIISLPSLLEQQKIANFLTAIDKRIAKLEERKSLLESYKKGVMQKIFSQKIHFKDDDGNDYPDWEEKKLRDVSQITTGKLDANAMRKNGKYRFYTCAKEHYFINDYAFDTEALLVSGNGANVGYIHYYKGKFNAYQRTYVLDKFSDNIIYIKYFLDKNLSQRIGVEKKDGNTPYIVMSTLSEMTINLPTLTEQQKIANFLTNLDNKIEAVQIQISESKTFKKGLLQQMFV
jgi:type I restriction enzyme S subunit